MNEGSEQEIAGCEVAFLPLAFGHYQAYHIKCVTDVTDFLCGLSQNMSRLQVQIFHEVNWK